MSLPRDIARCAGRFVDSEHGRVTDAECVACERRLQGVADYVGGAPVAWMGASKETPCPERLLTKQEARK